MAMEATEYAFPFDAEECEGGYDREYIADDFARYFRAFITSGIIADGGNIAESLQVVANDDMTTTLKKGNLMIDGYRYELMEDMIFHHTAADGVLDRIDRISITLDTAEREIYAAVRESEYSYKPVAPQCRRTSEHLDYVVADVRVVAGSIKIVQANITDTRLSTELCGVAFPFWRLDTQPFFAQLNSFYSEFVAKSDRSYQQFQEWQGDKKAEIEVWQAAEVKQTDDWQKKETDDFKEWANNFIDTWEGWMSGKVGDWTNEILDWFNNLRDQLTDNAEVHLQKQIGNLDDLKTTDKSNLVGAANELRDNIAAIDNIKVKSLTDFNTFYIAGQLINGFASVPSAEEVSAKHAPARGWFSVISFGAYANRIVQIAIQNYEGYDGSKIGDTYVRSKLDATWGAWRNITGNMQSTGASMSGPLNLANGAWNSVGDDVMIGDCNIAGCLGIKSMNSADTTGVVFYSCNGNVVKSIKLINDIFTIDAALSATSLNGWGDDITTAVGGGARYQLKQLQKIAVTGRLEDLISGRLEDLGRTFEVRNGDSITLDYTYNPYIGIGDTAQELLFIRVDNIDGGFYGSALKLVSYVQTDAYGNVDTNAKVNVVSLGNTSATGYSIGVPSISKVNMRSITITAAAGKIVSGGTVPLLRVQR